MQILIRATANPQVTTIHNSQYKYTVLKSVKTLRCHNILS